MVPQTHIVGLTGGIGAGKSTLSHWLRRLRIPVFDADQVVEEAYGRSEVQKQLKGLLPDHLIITKDHVRQAVRQKPHLLRVLEALFHPLVRIEALAFIEQQQQWKSPYVVLDIPLLFEAQMDELCHTTVVVEAPHAVRHARLQNRGAGTQDLAEVFYQRQLKDHERGKKADYTIVNDGHKRHTLRQLMLILKDLHRRNPGHA
ncbi:MAG: dephospho-CoA kinase [Holosporales bacterium]